LPLSGGTLTGYLILNANPTVALGAAPKQYVDAETTRAEAAEAAIPAATATYTNKRITRRVLALSANSATPAINTDNYDIVEITAQTAAITSFTSSLSGTPVDGDMICIAITGTAAVALTWGAKFVASTTALPTTTVTTARLNVLFMWSSTASAWICLAVA
jgi:hypothetical protein